MYDLYMIWEEGKANELLNVSAAWEEEEARRRAAEDEKRKAAAVEAAAEESAEPQTVKGWTASPRQIMLMRAGDREAVDKFFADNYKRLLACAYKFCRGVSRFGDWSKVRVFLDIDELINQVYVDLRCGYLVVDIENISKYIYHSFQYAAVGGFGDDYGAYEYHPRKKAEEVG